MKTEKKINYTKNSSQRYLKFLNNFYNQRKSRESIKTFKNSCSNPNINKNSSEIPYSIKPLFCSVPKDVSLHKIFVNMMNSSFKINGNKPIYFKMPEEDLEIRNYVLNKIKLFLEKNGIQKKILCSIIFLFDILTIKNKEKKLMTSFEEIGIGSALLTMKFLCGKKKSFFTIKNFSRIFQSEKISSKNFNEIEINCLKLIDYYLNYASPISFMEIFFINGIIFSTDKLKTEESGRIYELVIDISEKIMIISNEYIKYNPLCLCSCIVSLAREIYLLEKWPSVLTQAFGVNFYAFENIYNEFHELIIPTKNKESPKAKKKIDYDEIEDKDEIKLQTTYSVEQNVISTYKYKTPVKIENEKPKKYINIYYNNNYIFSKPITHKNIGSDNFSKYTKNKLLKNNYLNYYDNKITEENINKKRVEEMEIEIPSLSNNKNNSLRQFHDKSLNDNENSPIKINKKIIYVNKEEDYSNVATSENSNNYTKNNFRKNYKKNFIISYNNKKGNNQSIEQYKDEEENNDLGENSFFPKTTQRKYIKNCPRWSSIKKFCKLKEGKEFFFPVTESKPVYSKKFYK